MAELGATKLASYSDDQTVLVGGDQNEGSWLLCRRGGVLEELALSRTGAAAGGYEMSLGEVVGDEDHGRGGG